MIQKIDLPWGHSAEICNICGTTNRLYDCVDESDVVDNAPLQIGQVVVMYGKHLGDSSGRHFRDDMPTEWIVSDMRFRRSPYRAHELFVSFRSNEARLTISHSEFLLWQEGDVLKLQDARLIDCPRVRRTPRRSTWWGRLWQWWKLW